MAEESIVVEELAPEDEVQDWQMFRTANQDIIPKRGDKDFEPDGTVVQNKQLKESREAMYSALDVRRGHGIKQELVAVWFPQTQEAFVPFLKGPFFKDCGRPQSYGNVQGAWLSPWEAVYLCERGSMRVYLVNEVYETYLNNASKLKELEVQAKSNPSTSNNVNKLDDIEFDYDSHLISLSLAHLYSLAFSGNPKLIDKYQVYAHLKRLGYLVMPFKDSLELQRVEYQQLERRKNDLPPTIQNQILQKLLPIHESIRSWIAQYCPIHLLEITKKVSKYIGNSFSVGLQHCRDHGFGFSKRKHFFSYNSILQSLRLIPSYSTYDSLKDNHVGNIDSSDLSSSSFNVWKPTPQFSKKNPPVPDFQVNVTNTSYEPFPTLSTIQHLFNSSSHHIIPKIEPIAKPKTTKKNPHVSKRDVKLQRQRERQSKLDPQVQKRIEYLKLRDKKYKYGTRCFIIAAVDHGVINFVNLSEGDFSLLGYGTDELDSLNIRSESHGLVSL
ncbi:tRNA-splicing endonuclease subunit Sen54p [[Candida] anglica]|uniref:tRNA-splicing endonuclease subunit Sen54p n=1 Tax=[Candida] anglica TaxID=148631 RepID=A0ABP0EJS4_9ASCO